MTVVVVSVVLTCSFTCAWFTFVRFRAFCLLFVFYISVVDVMCVMFTRVCS